MPWFKVAFDHLKTLEILLCTVWMRNRFIKTCLKGTPDEHGLDDLDIKGVIHWRWMSVVLFCNSLASVYSLLVRRWCENKFLFKNGRQSLATKEDEWEDDQIKTTQNVQVKGITTALRNVLLRMFVEVVLHQLSSTVDFIYNFMSSCVCHLSKNDDDDDGHPKSLRETGGVVPINASGSMRHVDWFLPTPRLPGCISRTITSAEHSFLIRPKTRQHRRKHAPLSSNSSHEDSRYFAII
jgi:hypothetical protein